MFFAFFRFQKNFCTSFTNSATYSYNRYSLRRQCVAIPIPTHFYEPRTCFPESQLTEFRQSNQLLKMDTPFYVRI